MNYRRTMNIKQMNKFNKDIKNNSIKSLSLKLKVPYATLWRIINGDGGCNMRTWNKIENHYTSKERP